MDTTRECIFMLVGIDHEVAFKTRNTSLLEFSTDFKSLSIKRSIDAFIISNIPHAAEAEVLELTITYKVIKKKLRLKKKNLNNYLVMFSRVIYEG